jgi:hypothetical protein
LRIGLMLAPALSWERGFGNADCAQTCLGIAEVRVCHDTGRRELGS